MGDMGIEAGPDAALDQGPVTGTVTLRVASVGDAEAIAVVHVRTWREAYRGLIPQAHLDGLEVEARADRWRDVLAGRGEASTGRTLVAECEDTVVGFASFGPGLEPEDAVRGVGQLYAIYVDPDRWGTGVGAALIRAAVADLADSRNAEAVLWVIDGNERAQRFYQRMGWSRDGAGMDDEIGGATIPEVRYRIRLSPSGRHPGR